MRALVLAAALLLLFWPHVNHRGWPQEAMQSNWGPSCTYAAIASLLKAEGDFRGAQYIRSHYAGAANCFDAQAALRATGHSSSVIYPLQGETRSQLCNRLERFLASGQPSIVCVRSGGVCAPGGRVNHTIVLFSYSTTQVGLYDVNLGPRGVRFVPTEAFLRECQGWAVTTPQL